jgi:hypothetical protein
MENYKERRKKSDKAKEKYEKNGKYSSKTVRAMEQIKSNNVLAYHTKSQ